jgi:hypothetical protein
MSTSRVYKQAFKRAFVQKFHDEHMAVYWGRDDEMIHVFVSLRHYAHRIANDDHDALEFVSSSGDRVVVTLNDDERRQLEQTV